MKTGIFITALTFWFGMNHANATENKFHPQAEQIQEWVATHINYPESAKTEKVEGTVYVSFQVDNGKVTSASLLKEADPSLNKAAMDAIENLPSNLLNSSDKATFIIPIKFDLI